MVFGGLSLTWIWSGGLMIHFEKLENVLHLMLLLSFFGNLDLTDYAVHVGIEDKVHMNRSLMPLTWKFFSPVGSYYCC